MKTQRIRVASDRIEDRLLDEAAAALGRGALGAFPTETVYGLAADVTVDGALERLAALKERPAHKPFTLHVGSHAAFDRYVPGLNDVTRLFLRKALPGPLTVVFSLGDSDMQEVHRRLGPKVADRLYCDSTIGIRLPDHAVARGLLTRVSGAIVAPSANHAGAAPPNTAEDVLAQLDGEIDWVIDAGPTRYQRASTVVRIADRDMTVLRPGVLDEAVLRRMWGVNFLFVCTGNTCRSPMAEGLARYSLARRLGCNIDQLGDCGYNVCSAGVMAFGGSGATPEAMQACQELGVDVSRHRARPLASELIAWADVIYVMSPSHREAVLDLVPAAAARTHLLVAGGSVPDPVGQSLAVYRRCAGEIAAAVERRLNEWFGVGSV